MSDALKLRCLAATSFAALTVLCVWLIATVMGFTYDGLPMIIALAVSVGSAIWAFTVNGLGVESPRQYFSGALFYRPFLLTFGVFITLALIWGIGRSIIEWSIEPNIVDRGPCGHIYLGPCGESDDNSGRRYLATNLADKIAASLFFISPLALAIPKVRAVFR